METAELKKEISRALKNCGTQRRRETRGLNVKVKSLVWWNEYRRLNRILQDHIKNQTPHLDFYKKCMETGVMPECGLCENFELDKRLNLNLLCEFEPTPMEQTRLSPGISTYFWANEVGYEEDGRSSNEIRLEFGPLRQTIVLLLAAMNKEL